MRLHLLTIFVCVILLLFAQNHLQNNNHIETFCLINCGTKSKASVNIDTTIENKYMRDIVNENVMKHIAAVSQEQLINIENTGGSVVIENINMKMDAKINLDSVQKAENKQEIVKKLQNMLEQAVTVESSADTGFLGGVLGGATTSETNLDLTTKLVNETVTKITDRNVAECIVSVSQRQVINVKDTQGNVIVSGVNMTMVADAFAKCFSESIRELIIKTADENRILQDANAGSDAKSGGIEDVIGELLAPITGLFEGLGKFATFLIIGVIIIVVLGALGVGGYFLYSYLSGEKPLEIEPLGEPDIFDASRIPDFEPIPDMTPNIEFGE